MLSCVWLFVTPWMVARQAPLSMGFSRQGYCHGLPFPPRRDLPNPGIEPRSPASQAECLPFEPPGKGKLTYWVLRHPYCLPLWFPKQRVRFLASRQDTGRVFFFAMWFSQWKKKKKVLLSGFPNETVQQIPKQWKSQFTFRKPHQCAWISQLVLFFKCKPFRRSLVIWEKLLMRKKWTKQTHGENQLERNQDYIGREKKTLWKIRADILQ